MELRTDRPWAEEADAVLAALGSTPAGLSQAEVARRRATAGPNALPAPKPPGLLIRTVRQLDNLLILVLLAAAAVTALLGEWADTAVILAVVAANTAIGVVQEGKAERALESLRGMLAPMASVRREGRRQSIPATELVPGDIVLLEAGDRVPADLRLIAVENLAIDESMLTGESVPVAKAVAPVGGEAAAADRLCMAFSGSMVTEGTGTGVVTAIGSATEIGRISGLMAEMTELKTPLVRQMEQFARMLTGFVLTLSAALLAWTTLVRGEDFETAFMIVVGLFVAAIPEGLPTVLTVTLAIGVTIMARRHAIVRRLPKIETLGAVSVICTDKTGTLTLNEMTVGTLVTATGRYRVTGSGYAPEGEVELAEGEANPRALAAAAEIAAQCVTAALHCAEGEWTVEGDPMEGALLAFGGKLGHPPGPRPAPEAMLPFDARYRYMAVLPPAGAGGRAILIKGAPEAILERATAELGPEGPRPIDRAAWEAAAHAVAADGQRVLALALKPAEGGAGLDHGAVAEGLILAGLAGLIDPPRPEAAEAVAQCRAAGIAVKMITGDHAGTATAIARRIGLERPDAVMTGAELERLDAATLAEAVERTDVFARTSPEHKLRLVEALQARGRVVAMTGDGVNDAPALKRADVGIAMGRKGSEAARAAAGLVLTDDNFASIVEAVRQGRTVYANLRKVIAFLLPVNGGESMGLVIAAAFGLMLPITPLQILWVNMLSSVALALPLAFEPPERGVMARPPRRPDAPILTRFILWRVFLVSALFSGGIFAQFHLALGAGASLETARTMAVNTLVAMEIFYLFSIRFGLGPSLTLQGVRGTPPVLLALGAVLLLQSALTYAPPLQQLFGTAPLDPIDLARCALAGILLFAVLEVDKAAAAYWRRRRGR